MERRLDKEREALRGVSEESAKSLDALLTPEMTKEVMAVAERGVADDEALKYMTRIEAEEDYETVKKDILALPPYKRSAVHTAFNAHYAAYKTQQREIVADSVISAREKMDELSAQPDGLAQMYKYAHDLPATNQTERKIKKQLSDDYATYARFFGKNKLTDPTNYMVIYDGIQTGDIQNEKELMSHPYAATVAKSDMETLKTFLHKSSIIDQKEIETAYRYAIGDNNGPYAGSVKGQSTYAENFLSFQIWALETAKKTKRGQEPGYALELAKLWRQAGETDARFGFGYGRNTTYGDSAYDDRFLPDLAGENLKEVQAVFAAHPETAKRWMAAVGGNPGYAMRAYWKALQEEGLLKPKQRAREDY
jgi:hypothetical protein